MMCSQPFMRNKQGKVRWSTKITEEEKLDCTPFPCGCCLPCRINNARTKQHRIMLEAKSHTNSAFITLTYNDEHLPFTLDGLTTLCKRDLQNYFKRLRRKLKYEIRYFAVGEYGTKKSDITTFEGERPHYHAIVFGINQLDYEHISGAWKICDEPIGS